MSWRKVTVSCRFLRIKNFERTATLGLPVGQARVGTRELEVAGGGPVLPAWSPLAQSWHQVRPRLSPQKALLDSSVLSLSEPQLPAIATQRSGCPLGWEKPARPVALPKGHHLTRAPWWQRKDAAFSRALRPAGVGTGSGAVDSCGPSAQDPGCLGPEDPQPKGTAEPGRGQHAPGAHRVQAHRLHLPLPVALLLQ